MVIVCILFSTILTTCGLVLLTRLFRAARDVKKMGSNATTLDGFRGALIRLLVNSIDKSLLSQAGSRGLADIEVRFREAQDPFRTTHELVQSILKISQANTSVEVMQLIKYVYQLQQSLDVPSSDLAECLGPLLRQIISTLFANKPAGKTKLVQAGDLVDQKTMFPLNSGSRVRQPLGVIIVDADDNVVSKAKVLCS